MRSDIRRLLVRVGDELTLDAGGWFEVHDEGAATLREVEPPARTLFDQLVDHLGKLPPEPRYTELRLAEEAAAAAALCLRWGSYLAVLLDREKPLWKGAREEGLSRVSDEEMARINIEASAALERWIDLLRAGGDRSWDLRKKASRLPSVFRSAHRDRSVRILDLTDPEAAAALARPLGLNQRERRLWEPRSAAYRIPLPPGSTGSRFPGGGECRCRSARGLHPRRHSAHLRRSFQISSPSLPAPGRAPFPAGSPARGSSSPCRRLPALPLATGPALPRTSSRRSSRTFLPGRPPAGPP